MRVTAVSVILSLLLCCSTKKDSKVFIGKWKSIEHPARQAYIVTKEGDAFVLTFEKTNNKVPLVLNPDGNTMTINAGLATGTIAYNKDKDRIIVSGEGEFERIK